MIILDLSLILKNQLLKIFMIHTVEGERLKVDFKAYKRILLNHLATVKITELCIVKVETVNFRPNFRLQSSLYLILKISY